MHVHIIGICGTFMGGLAQLARARGFKVTGCDANVYPPMSTQLEQAGIDLVEGFSADQLSLKPDVWVVGNVATRGMPLIEALLNARARLVSGPQWLAENLLHDHQLIAVSGTHGKTTTSSLVAWLLEDAGLAPSFLIGGVPENFGVSARLTSGASASLGTPTSNPSTPFVIEADEYDTAFFDKRSKLLHYRAQVAVLNNLEFDHADIFADLAAIETQFYHWIRTLPANGRLIVNAREPALARVIRRGAYTPIDWFNVDTPQAGVANAPGAVQGWSAKGDQSQFTVLYNGQEVGQVESPLTGEHNRSNVLAAIAAAVAAGADAKKACKSVARFAGIKRRMQLRGEVKGIAVFDDFAHHPTAIATTLDGLKASMQKGQRDTSGAENHASSGRILAVIEPRSNTMKLGVMAAKLAPSLAQADHTFAYAGGIDWNLQEALSPLGSRASTHSDLADMIAAIARMARPGDRVLVMSNGGFGGIHDKLLAALAAA